jgi:hypothetical protein
MTKIIYDATLARAQEAKRKAALAKDTMQLMSACMPPLILLLVSVQWLSPQDDVAVTNLTESL